MTASQIYAAEVKANRAAYLAKYAAVAAGNRAQDAAKRAARKPKSPCPYHKGAHAGTCGFCGPIPARA